MAFLVVLGLDSKRDAERALELLGPELLEHTLYAFHGAGDEVQIPRSAGEIDDDLMRRAVKHLPPGRLGLILLVPTAAVDLVLKALGPFKPTVLNTGLGGDRGDHRDALRPEVEEAAPETEPTTPPSRRTPLRPPEDDEVRGGLRGPPPAHTGSGLPPPLPSPRPLPQRRHLRARLRDRVSLGERLDLRAWIAVEADVRPGWSMPLAPFDVPPEGVTVDLIVWAPAFTAAGPERQSVLVPPSGDSTPVLFPLTPTVAGAQKIAIEAWRAGSYLGQLEFEVMVGRDGSAGRDRELTATVASEHHPGEISLAIRYNDIGKAYRFEFRDDHDNPREVVSDSLIQAPWGAIRDLLDGLDRLALPNSRSHADVRGELVGQGMRLWRTLVPDRVREQFWSRVDRIHRLTIVADEKDPVPWELLFPVRQGEGDFGFLVERIPVVRALFDHECPQRLPCTPASYVLPPGSPSLAKAELERVHRWLRDPTPLEPVEARDSLKNLLSSGQAGLLHFACHNSFTEDGGGPRVLFGPEPFTSIDLEAVRNMGTLRQKKPLVFLNACRSAGQFMLYTRLDGWAQAFLEGGAGAFIGTLWSVQDEAAAQFADVFYSAFAGEAVGFADAVHRARLMVGKRQRDPSWLAYTAYGHPAARITPES
jgi:hypothetical protein